MESVSGSIKNQSNADSLLLHAVSHSPPARHTVIKNECEEGMNRIPVKGKGPKEKKSFLRIKYLAVQLLNTTNCFNCLTTLYKCMLV